MQNTDCKCSLSQAVLGDGCQWCNPSLAEELRLAEEAERSSGRVCGQCKATCLSDASLMCLSACADWCDGDDLFF